MKALYKPVLLIILLSSISLMTVNIYGLSKDLRPENLSPEFLRFGERDLLLSKQEYFDSVTRTYEETDIEYAKRLTRVISEGTAHVDWEVYDPAAFHQLIPIWENWILYFMGKFSGIPEYERYHFSSPKKSMERGIGICGDASILMSQLLSENGIDNKIITFPGHVVIAADFTDEQLVFDPDFGVVIPYSIDDINKQASIANNLYYEQGYSLGEERFLINEYGKPFGGWNGPEHLITNKFYFEKFAYIGKWAFPVIGIMVFILLFVLSNRKIVRGR